MSSLSTQLRAARARRGHTQDQAARALGVSRQTVSMWERGALPGLAQSRHVADYVGCTVLAIEELRAARREET